MLLVNGGTSVGSVCTIGLHDELDSHAVPELRSEISIQLSHGVSQFEFDCSDVSYADSTALGFFAWLDKEVSQRDGIVDLIHVPQNMSRVFDVSGILPFLRATTLSCSISSSPLLGGEIPDYCPEWIELYHIPADFSALSSARQEIEQAFFRYGFPSSLVDDLRIALGEALNNAVKHGLHNVSEPELDVVIKGYSSTIIIDVIDNGHGFDGEFTPPEDVFADTGRGILFMRSLMDTVTFQKRTEGGTVVRMVKEMNAS